MDLEFNGFALVGTVLAAAFLVLAGLVYFAAPHRSANRWLAAALLVETWAGQTAVLRLWFADEVSLNAMLTIDYAASFAVPWLYLAFIGQALSVSIARPFRGGWARVALGSLAVLFPMLVVFVDWPDAYLRIGLGAVTIPIFVFGFLAALLAVRASPPGVARSRAIAYAAAFGFRDMVVVGILVAHALRLGLLEEFTWPVFIIYETISIVYLGLLSFGILRLHLFEVDVKLQHAIRQGLPAAVYAGVFVLVTQFVENGLNQSLGWVWGSLAAAVLLVALSPLRRLGDAAAHRALPDAKPLRRLTQDERAAFYADHVRAAWEDGSIDRSDRTLLDTLRARLGLRPEEAGLIEIEAAPRATA